ncbi:MAG: SpoIIE family protein phosphatase [Bacteroidia bacterium]
MQANLYIGADLHCAYKKQVDIFIVDDNKIFALALKVAIENAFINKGIKIHTFETGEHCMEKFRQVMPELVILDYHLNSNSPNAEDGLQVLGKMKGINADTSVIMLTNNDHIDIALTSFHHGASDYVVKTDNQFKDINRSIRQIFNDKALAFESREKAKQVIELLLADKELDFQKEKERQMEELISVNIQKAEAEKSKLVVEEKHKSITDSINYAKRIQQAKLPKKEEIYDAFTDCFVLFKPKDIVSGDFYFFHKSTLSYRSGGEVFIAAADCTGHGVPGALLSMVCSERLHDAVALSANPSEILNRLNKGVKTSLHQSESFDTTRDGMDIALCAVNTEKGTVKFAGANRPLWVIRKGMTTVEEIKGTKKAIGGYTEDNQQFDTHEINLQKGDSFYIFSDGYADTFGGEAGKKLMTKKFKEILLNIQHKPMPEQEAHLESFIEDWKAGAEQIDDILVIGVRL